MIEALKKINRALLELWTGIILVGAIVNIVAIIPVARPGQFSVSLWCGCFGAVLGAYHIYHTLDVALDCDEKTASRKIYVGYAIRYITLIIVFAIICLTKVLDPVAAFVGYMALKFGAYLQPFLHKFYNRLFHETDPIPQPLEDEEEILVSVDAMSDGDGTEN